MLTGFVLVFHSHPLHGEAKGSGPHMTSRMIKAPWNMVSGRDACNSDPFGPQKVENLLVVKLGPVSAIQGKGRRDQAHSAPSLCVSWERTALSCVLCNRGQMTSHLSSLRSPSAQKPSDLCLHQKPSELHSVPSAPMADERHQEHGSQEAVQGPDEEVHGKTEVAGMWAPRG